MNYEGEEPRVLERDSHKTKRTAGIWEGTQKTVRRKFLNTLRTKIEQKYKLEWENEPKLLLTLSQRDKENKYFYEDEPRWFSLFFDYDDNIFVCVFFW